MASDPRSSEALRALAAARQRYRSAVTITLEQLRGHLATHCGDVDGRVGRLRAELGPFGAARIDLARLADVLDGEAAVEPAAIAQLERAFETLQEMATRPDEFFHVDVTPGGDLAAAVGARLADAGRAFGAARLAARVWGGRPAPTADDDQVFDSFPFARWSAGERRVAPPLVVSLGGADLRAGTLAEFLDGGQQIVLVVDGECAPAPLVRLITPGTLVIQTDEAAGLGRLTSWVGPAVGALVPASAARFVHDPAGGSEPWERLMVQHLPGRPRAEAGGLSVGQQAEELGQLAALASPPRAAPATGADAPPSPDPAGQLAAWLLSEANLPEHR